MTEGTDQKQRRAPALNSEESQESHGSDRSHGSHESQSSGDADSGSFATPTQPKSSKVQSIRDLFTRSNRSERRIARLIKHQQWKECWESAKSVIEAETKYQKLTEEGQDDQRMVANESLMESLSEFHAKTQAYPGDCTEYEAFFLPPIDGPGIHDDEPEGDIESASLYAQFVFDLGSRTKKGPTLKDVCKLLSESPQYSKIRSEYLTSPSRLSEKYKGRLEKMGPRDGGDW